VLLEIYVLYCTVYSCTVSYLEFLIYTVSYVQYLMLTILCAASYVQCLTYSVLRTVSLCTVSYLCAVLCRVSVLLLSPNVPFLRACLIVSLCLIRMSDFSRCSTFFAEITISVSKNSPENFTELSVDDFFARIVASEKSPED
jgi:hypothetical protein